MGGGYGAPLRRASTLDRHIKHLTNFIPETNLNVNCYLNNWTGYVTLNDTYLPLYLVHQAETIS